MNLGMAILIAVVALSEAFMVSGVHASLRFVGHHALNRYGREFAVVLLTAVVSFVLLVIGIAMLILVAYWYVWASAIVLGLGCGADLVHSARKIAL